MAINTLAPNIWQAKQRRLHKLEQQAATYGVDTPPQIATEIEDLQRELTAASPTTIAESHDILYGLLAENRADVRRIIWIGMPILAVALTIAVIALILVLVLL